MHAPRFTLATALPRPAQTMLPAGGFVVCPVALRPAQVEMQQCMQAIYRMAYEQACAAVAPTWYDRASVPSAN